MGQTEAEFPGPECIKKNLFSLQNTEKTVDIF